MTKYRIQIRRKDYEFSFEEENLKTFKDELPNFLSFVVEFEKPVAVVAGKTSKRGGGRRPPFIKTAILELLEKRA